MPRPHHSPIVMLAFPRFQKDFGDLLNSNALITDFTRSLIEGIFENIMWFDRTDKDYKQFERTTRAAYHFISEGNNIRPKEISQYYSLIVDNIIPSLNNSVFALNEAKNIPTEEPDNQIKKYLESYKVMYEGLLRFICAPVVYAFGIVKHVKDKKYIPDDNGKISLTTLQNMEKLMVYSDNRLAIGLNGHVRNAYSHENYKILDNAKVELWDPNPYKPNKSWGPEIWSLEKLIDLNNQLFINALGIICALLIYDISNRRVATNRGWITPKQLPKLRHEELKDTVDDISEKLGFYLKEIELLNDQVSITLSPKSKGIDQESDLYMSYEHHTRLYKVKMWYEEKRIIDQLTRLIVTLIPYIGDEPEVLINVVSHEGSLLGSLSVDMPLIIGLNLTDTEPDTVNSIRYIYKIDTIGEKVTYVEKKGTPRLFGTGPPIPKTKTPDK